MKTTFCIIAAASIASASAFVPAAKTPQSTQLHIATKGTVAPVKKSISGLTKDNFDSTLKEIEDFLTKEAGSAIYKKSMKRINVKASALGVSVPADYAKDAKCTKKRREKQDAYCKAKAEEAAAAAEEEAEEAPAEEASEEAPAEE